MLRPKDVLNSIEAPNPESFSNMEELIAVAITKATAARLPIEDIDRMEARIREVGENPAKLKEYFPGGWIHAALKKVLKIEE